MTRTAAFVGRRRELVILDSAFGGASRLVLVVGDAGVGKSRLVGEALRRARAAGALTVVCGCLPLVDKLPLLPVAQALTELDRAGDGRTLVSALDRLPGFVRTEVARLLPGLAEPAGMDGRPRGSWERERLFAAVARVLSEIAQGDPLVLLVEDLHWADAATLDLLTYLPAAAGPSLIVAVTCRGDEPGVGAEVLDWLAQARRSALTVEVRLVALTRDETAEQAADLIGRPVPAPFVDELHARSEGNPFYTEQLVAAALTGATGPAVALPRVLPGGLADLLATRAGRVGGPARAVLAALAVAGRSLTEPSLCAVTGLAEQEVADALEELAAAKLLAPFDGDPGCRPRHALLAEAVLANLRPGERLALHVRTATALEALGDPALLGEVAGHWARAGRPADELRTTVAAAGAAAQMLAFSREGDLWCRAIELYDALPDAAGRLELDPARLHLSAVDAYISSGRGEDAAVVAEHAYRRFAAHPDRTVAAYVHARAGFYRSIDDPAAGRPLLEEGLRLFEGTPPSREHAQTLLRFANHLRGEGRGAAGLGYLERALAAAEAADADDMTIRVTADLAFQYAVQGRLDAALQSLRHANDLARTLEANRGDYGPGTALAVSESDLLLKAGRLHDARDAGCAGYERATRGGRRESYSAAVGLANAVQAAFELGDTAGAARLLDPVDTDTPRLDSWPLCLRQAQVDLRRGQLEPAAQRVAAVLRMPIGGDLDNAREMALVVAEVALWRRQPDAALAEILRVLARLEGTEQELLCGELLALGARAAADLASGGESGLLGVERLEAVAERLGGRPFAAQPYLAQVRGAHADWTAERGRARGADDPAAWAAAAAGWEELGRPHRAGYAWWRHAQARLNAGAAPETATEPLRRAAAAAAGMAPLAAAVASLARRARVTLHPTPGQEPPPPADPFGLTERERSVLRLVAAGDTNAEIGRKLYMSPKTASVHVSNILRKLQVTNRVQAAGLAERAGLLDESQPG
ncbi:AAA family ATPase [Dactylosporangium sp. NPDC049525]|uniref:helix-turn-helix transcriptional regulator n=1 Tax=Dactylosporangium sp. NPDC049525 TaxID=3154730 RepID=UPI00343B1407